MTGTWVLIRLALRRDRILLPAWILGLSLMVVFSVTATKDLYPTQASLTSAADTLNATGAFVALYGKVYDPTSLGAISLIKLTAFGAALVAILFVFIAVRHTRAEEETGRMELVDAGAVGRAAPLTAALVVGIGSSFLLGATTALGLGTTGLPWPGAIAFGLGWACSGMVFTAIGAVMAQVTTSARAALGLGMAAVGASYALRAVGDLAAGNPGVLSWLSPIGWSQQFRPFAGDRWWVIVLPVVATLILIPVAFALRAHRDLGSGYLPDRPGPSKGNLSGVVGLAWRLQRGMFAAWFVGIVLMGLVLGSVVSNVAGLLDSPQMSKYVMALGGEQALTAAFLAAEVAILCLVAAAYAVASSSRLRSEEVNGHVELLLSTATSRLQWAWSHLVIALLGAAVLALAAGAAIGLTHGIATGDVLGQVVRVTGAAAAQIPAIWVMVGIVMAIFGVLPRWVVGAWALLVAFIVLGEFGVLWQLPNWVLKLSPFAHSPKLPGGDVSIAQLALLLGVALVLLVVGSVSWRARNVQD